MGYNFCTWVRVTIFPNG